MSRLTTGNISQQEEKRLRIGKGKSVETAIEEIKQRVTAVASKLRRYKDRTRAFRENHLMRTNEGAFYRSLEDPKPPVQPTEEEIKKWRALWSVTGPQAGNIEPLTDIQQHDRELNNDDLRKAMRKMRNWKAAGTDEVHGYWLKNFTILHKCLLDSLNQCIEQGCPEWMTLGATVLLPKPEKPGDNRPITFLPTTWKLLTSMIAEDITNHMESNNIIPEEQKGCRRKTRGCKDQLLIDQAIIANCKKRRSNLSMAWIDFKKAYDSVTHEWLQKSMKSVGISEKWIEFLTAEMKK